MIRAEAGNPPGAADDLRAAIAAFDAKGATVDATRARALLTELDPALAGKAGRTR